MLDFSLVNIICIVVNLLILFILMKLFLFKPVEKIIKKRQEEADEQINQATAAKEEAEKLQQEYEETMKKNYQELIVQLILVNIYHNIIYV